MILSFSLVKLFVFCREADFPFKTSPPPSVPPPQTTTYHAMKPPTFVYGTLCSPQVVQVLLGRSIHSYIPAKLYGHARYPVQKFVFPGTIATPSEPQNVVDGFLLEGLTLQDDTLFDWFEGSEYEKVLVSVQRMDTQEYVPAKVYLWKQELVSHLEVDRTWDYAQFERTHLDWYLENTVTPCRQETERLGMTSDE